MILVDFNKKIKGDCQLSKHKEWIQCESVNLGANRGVEFAGGSAKRQVSHPMFSEVTFSKSADRASADLFMQAICGVSLGDATVNFSQTAGQDEDDQVFQSWTLHDAIITSYNQSSGGGGLPSESFSVSFTKITFQYNEFDGTKVKKGDAKKWDLQTNKTF